MAGSLSFFVGSGPLLPRFFLLERRVARPRAIAEMIEWLLENLKGKKTLIVRLSFSRLPHDPLAAQHLPRVLPPHRRRYRHRIPPHPHQRGGESRANKVSHHHLKLSFFILSGSHYADAGHILLVHVAAHHFRRGVLHAKSVRNHS